ncbi:hypothetical protein OAF58_00845 [bacterium]|nr:hypothetical protein [bacterium]
MDEKQFPSSIAITKPVDFDSDDDGLADVDEQPVRGTDYTLWDTDGDGFGDGYEVASGYLPTSAASTPEMQRTGHFGNGGQSFTVSFEAAFGRTYRLESCDDLETWIPMEAGIVGPGGPVTRSYPIPGVIRRFYRIVRE